MSLPPAAPSPVPPVTDGVVTLRAHTPGDVDAIVEQCTDPEMQRWTTVPRNYSREDALGFLAQVRRAWAEPDGNRHWAIEFVDGEEPRFAGTIDLRRGESPRTAEVGFGLHPAARGRGLMSRAVRLAATHAFTDDLWGAPVQRIHWRAIAGNGGSRRVAWSTGFTFHGTLPETHLDLADPSGPGLDSWHASLGAADPVTPQIPWFSPVPLEGESVLLREWRDDDVESIEERNDPPHWMPERSVLNRGTFADWLYRRRSLMAAGEAIEWCVADVTTDRALGNVTLFSRGAPMTGDTAELGYQLNPAARGRGVMREATRLVVGLALRPTVEGGLGLRRLVAQTAADNAASNRVLEALGFVVYGRERAVDRLPDGSWGDGLHWELLPAGT
jgi:RimJ/RimL family protein N-acetyltransferase